MNGIVISPTWIVPIDTEAIRDGFLVACNGTIEYIGRELPDRFLSLPLRRLERTAILPGWINSHCHLEFSDLERPIPPRGPFNTWLSDVIQHRSATVPLSPDEQLEARKSAIQRGLAEAWRGGTRWIIDNVTSPWKPEWIIAWNRDLIQSLPRRIRESLTPSHVVVVRPCPEIIDVQPIRFQQTSHLLSERLDAPKLESVDEAGVAPHAPYTASLHAVRYACELSKQRKRLVTMHLAETREELDWLDHRRGSLGDWIRTRLSQEHLTSIGTVSQHLDVLEHAYRSLVVHGNYLTKEQIAMLSERSTHMAVVVCPRTHAWFGHKAHPMANLLQMGGNVFLGTDSKASNPSLEMWPEAQMVHRWFPELSLDLIASLISCRPARFMQSDPKVGILEVGNPSLLTAFRWEPSIDPDRVATEPRLWEWMIEGGTPFPLEMHPELLYPKF
jgi:cytosine/adenosine deaminase-related metal-dependent hydrolase